MKHTQKQVLKNPFSNSEKGLIMNMLEQEAEENNVICHFITCYHMGLVHGHMSLFVK